MHSPTCLAPHLVGEGGSRTETALMISPPNTPPTTAVAVQSSAAAPRNTLPQPRKGHMSISVCVCVCLYVCVFVCVTNPSATCWGMAVTSACVCVQIPLSAALNVSSDKLARHACNARRARNSAGRLRARTPCSAARQWQHGNTSWCGMNRTAGRREYADTHTHTHTHTHARTHKEGLKKSEQRKETSVGSRERRKERRGSVPKATKQEPAHGNPFPASHKPPPTSVANSSASHCTCK